LSEKLSPMTDVANMFSVEDYMYFYSDYLNPDRSDAETEAVVHLLSIDRPMQILDLACGFGRIANRLARRGHQVVGVEYQEGFLSIARQEAASMRLAGRGGSVVYRQGDMRQLDESDAYDRVIMVFNSFGYFPDEENLQVLRNVARALRPGGLVGFDVANRDGVLNDFHPHYVSEKEDSLMINRFSFDVLTGRLYNDRIIIRSGVRKDLPFSIRLYSATEMRDQLEKAGLHMVGVYSEWDGQPLQMDSPAMVVIAEKR
jgi:SAM-dependent methyltransferase